VRGKIFKSCGNSLRICKGRICKGRNYTAFGILFFKLLLQLTDYSKNFRDKLFEFCKLHPNITCFIEQVGSYPIEIEVEIPDYQSLNDFVDKFREQFDHGLNSCETLMIKKDHMHKFPESFHGQN